MNIIKSPIVRKKIEHIKEEYHYKYQDADNDLRAETAIHKLRSIYDYTEAEIASIRFSDFENKRLVYETEFARVEKDYKALSDNPIATALLVKYQAKAAKNSKLKTLQDVFNENGHNSEKALCVLNYESYKDVFGTQKTLGQILTANGNSEKAASEWMNKQISLQTTREYALNKDDSINRILMKFNLTARQFLNEHPEFITDKVEKDVQNVKFYLESKENEVIYQDWLVRTEQQDNSYLNKSEADKHQYLKEKVHEIDMIKKNFDSDKTGDYWVEYNKYNPNSKIVDIHDFVKFANREGLTFKQKDQLLMRLKLRTQQGQFKKLFNKDPPQSSKPEEEKIKELKLLNEQHKRFNDDKKFMELVTEWNEWHDQKMEVEDWIMKHKGSIENCKFEMRKDILKAKAKKADYKIEKDPETEDELKILEKDIDAKNLKKKQISRLKKTLKMCWMIITQLLVKIEMRNGPQQFFNMIQQKLIMD